MKILYHSYGIEVYPFVSKLGIIKFSALIGISTFLIFLGELTYRCSLKKEKNSNKNFISVLDDIKKTKANLEKMKK
jgi:hypothetical protein